MINDVLYKKYRLLDSSVTTNLLSNACVADRWNVTDLTEVCVGSKKAAVHLTRLAVHSVTQYLRCQMLYPDGLTLLLSYPSWIGHMVIVGYWSYYNDNLFLVYTSLYCIIGKKRKQINNKLLWVNTICIHKLITISQEIKFTRSNNILNLVLLSITIDRRSLFLYGAKLAQSI